MGRGVEYDAIPTSSKESGHGIRVMDNGMIVENVSNFKIYCQSG